MSDYLDRIHNNAPSDDAELPLLELTCNAWAQPIRLAVSPRDETVTLPAGGSATFVKSGARLQLPDATSSAKHDLNFQLAGATEDVIEQVDSAIEADEFVHVVVYIYTQTQRSAPQETFSGMQVTHVSMTDDGAAVTAQFRDIANSTFPRLLFTAQNTPGLKYYAQSS